MITKTRVSVLAMLVLAALSVAYIMNVGLHVRTPSERSASLVVPDTNGIMTGSRVLLRGIEIGHVVGIDQTATGVKLTLNYDQSQQIPVDSRFRVDNLSALGEAYVAVLPETAAGPYLAENATIDTDRVSVPTTFKELSEQLTVLLQQTDSDAVRRIFDTVDEGLPDGVDVLGTLNRAGGLLSGELTQQSDSFITLLSTMQPLLMRSAPIPALMRETSPRMLGFGTGFEELLASVRDATVTGPLLAGIRDGGSPLFTELQKFLDENSAHLNVIGVNLLPAAQAGAASLRTVDVGAVLDRALAATTPRGALTVRVPAGGR
ncbi:MlaD family protein [Gordonia tangerina]|uniref:MlaD family protein n=1 Tax=Gordonia tangerina TaxID=2911060 RepID=A0ABS9DKQ6_9ACTN|nr:MlaD family protein [Gordonia tangerina]MCF3939656.1 MlaD family protein [Gordonia tangerina]